jgi:hypothetical protein
MMSLPIYLWKVLIRYIYTTTLFLHLVESQFLLPHSCLTWTLTPYCDSFQCKPVASTVWFLADNTFIHRALSSIDWHVFSGTMCCLSKLFQCVWPSRRHPIQTKSPKTCRSSLGETFSCRLSSGLVISLGGFSVGILEGTSSGCSRSIAGSRSVEGSKPPF